MGKQKFGQVNWFKEKIHSYFIKQMILHLGEARVDIKERKINVGLYSIGLAFFTPKEQMACSILVSWFGYKLYEERIQFAFTQRSAPLSKFTPSDDVPQYIKSRSWRQEAVAGMPDEKPQPNSSQ